MIKKTKTIVFGGIIGNTIDNPITGVKGDFNNEIERAREKKHLKAYLKGHERFVFGKDIEGKPQYYPVIRVKTT